MMRGGKIIGVIKFIMSQYAQLEPEEGFFSCRPTLSITKHLHSFEQQLRPLFYQPRVLTTYPMHLQLKLPRETLAAPFHIAKQHNIPPQSTAQNPQMEQATKQAGGCQKLILVYNKFGGQSHSPATQLQTNREVNLDNLLQYQQKDYLLLKQKSAAELLQPQQRLEFQSKFECSNLHSAYQDVEKLNHYYFLIENDTNTHGYNQFFYFAIRGVKKETAYRFSIINFTKQFSFFKEGMKPIFFSLKRHKNTGCGWFQKGNNIKYDRSDCSLLQNHRRKYYTLSFEVQFEEDQEFITVSSNVPYSYSRLIHKIKELKNLSVEKDVFFKMQTIAYTVSNNQVPQIIICKEPPTNISQQIKKSPNRKMSKNAKQSDIHRKKVIVITARQHPGETNSSLLIEHILQSLVEQPNEKISWLLRHYEFRIYPMINVDGVIYGNSRCDLTGFDLNRTWRHPIKQLHPQIYYIKNQLRQFQQRHKIYYCIDLHSHSKMYNVFTYGCKKDEITCRVFAQLLSKNTPLFHLPSCMYGLSFDKRDTFRAALSRITRSQNVTTVECSYYGSKKGKQVNSFNDRMFEQIAVAILCALRSQLKKDVNMKNCLNEIKDKMQREIVEEDPKQKDQQISDSEVEQDKSSLESKLKRLFRNQQFIDKIKKRYEDEENELEIEERKETALKYAQQDIADTIQINQPIQPKNQELSPKSEEFKSPEEKLTFPQLENNEQPVPKYNINTDLPFVKNFKQTWNRPKKALLNPSSNFNSQQVITQESPRQSNPLVFDDREFQRQMKFLYRELSNGLRDLYLRHSKIKEKERSERRNDFRTRRLQSLKSLSINASTAKNRKKIIMNTKSMLPKSSRVEEHEVLLRIKSEHCEVFTEKEDSFRWRYNSNQSEMLQKSVDKEMQALRNRQKVGHLPIFHKFFKLKQRSSFRQ